MWWEILGLNEDADIKTVKRQYKKIIKTIDMDYEIERFTEIKDAYDRAMDYFRYGKVQEANNDIHEDVLESQSKNEHENSEEDETVLESSVEDEDIIEDYSEQDSREKAAEKVMFQALYDVYTDHERRFLIEEWEAAFDQLTLEEEMIFEENYVGFFNRFYHFTRPLWVYFQDRFNLLASEHFSWYELVKGSFLIETKELEGLDRERVNEYMENRIKGYYTYHQGNYELAAEASHVLISLPVRNMNILRMGLVTGYETGDQGLFDTCYESLIGDDEHKYFAHHYRSMFEARTGEYNKALKHELVVKVDKAQCRLEKIKAYLDFRWLSFPWIHSLIMWLKGFEPGHELERMFMVDRVLISKGLLPLYKMRRIMDMILFRYYHWERRFSFNLFEINVFLLVVCFIPFAFVLVNPIVAGILLAVFIGVFVGLRI